MDLRLKTMPFEFDGRKYELRCNMSVIADVQEAYKGDLNAALSRKSTAKGVLTFLSAMLNDYADEMGWDVSYTPRQVGRMLPPTAVTGVFADVMALVAASLQGDEPSEASSEPEGDGKN